jgi:hypothetical protein
MPYSTPKDGTLSTRSGDPITKSVSFDLQMASEHFELFFIKFPKIYVCEMLDHSGISGLAKLEVTAIVSQDAYYHTINFSVSWVEASP